MISSSSSLAAASAADSPSSRCPPKKFHKFGFLTDGALYKSDADDNQGDLITMHAGDFVQLQAGERHRLVGGDTLTVVAEIWQHTDANSLSDEDDIVRIEDDFKRQ